jgi:hypothetical protein
MVGSSVGLTARGIFFIVLHKPERGRLLHKNGVGGVGQGHQGHRLDYRVPYASRHTLGQWSLLIGMAKNRLIDLMGHSTEKVVDEVYGHNTAAPC